MTPREKILSQTFFLVLGTALTLAAVSLVLDSWAAQDQALVTLKARALTLAAPGAKVPAPLDPNLFLAPGTPESTAGFAGALVETFGKYGLRPQGFRITEEAQDHGWVEFHLRCRPEPWVRFLAGTTGSVPRPLFRNVSLHAAPGGTYDLTFEVGYARLPQ